MLARQNQSLILKKKPSEYLTECKAVTIYDCLNSPAGSLAKLEREGVNTQALVKYLLSDLVEVFNFGKNMSDTQLTNCANSLIELYWNFTPEDFLKGAVLI